jgi:DNA polymerase
MPCDVLFIGEAPGKSEDVVGEPFVGRAGKLLDSWIVPVFKTRSLTWCITNTVACRPTDFCGGANRQPSPEELQLCKPRLFEFINACEPLAIILLGRVAAEHLADLNRCSILELPHPAYILRNGGMESSANDEIRRKLGDFLDKYVIAHDERKYDGHEKF